MHEPPPEKIDPALLKPYMMPDGDVALECESLCLDENISVFGDDGVCPPRPVETLVDGCLEMMAAVPDVQDTAALRSMVTGLKNSLAKVETTLDKLDG